MSDLIQVLISAKLDEATRKQLQAELDQIAKKASSAVSATRKKSTQEDRVNNEASIKLWKAQESAIARVRKSEETQSKAVVKAQEEQEKAINETIKINQKLKDAEKKRVDAAIKDSERIISQIRKENDLRDQQADTARKYSINQQQLVSGQQGSLTNRLQGMAIGKDDVFKKFPDLKTQYASLEKDIAKFGSTGSKTYKQLSNDMGAFNNNLKKSSVSMKANLKDGYNFLTMVETGIKKMIVWSIAATAMYAPIRALQAGLQTLRELDTLMVDIAKVTNLTAREMENLVVNSFDAASALGQTAQSYLAAVAEFSRAGYEGQAEGLAELALLSQNVGELTSEQATQFLLATDAAYKYRGEQNALMKVLDGVNEIDNKFATSIAKVSEGMTVAGSIASNAGVGVDELAATLGTMTAATQRSGSEAGRAFRGIIMNLRQIKGETEDGDIIDAEALSKSAKALDAVNIKVHETRNGIEELRNPMDILSELAEKWEKLSSMDQAPIIEALGGKYRGNERLLTAPYVLNCA